MNKEQLIGLIVSEVIKNVKYTIPIGISSRHVHLSEKDIEILFGQGYRLTPRKELQPGQFAAEETVTMVGPKGIIKKVRILGPVRSITQVEISRTDAFVLGINPPLRDSGVLQGSASLVLVGPAGCLKLNEGVICAARHIHFHTSDAQKLGIRDGDRVKVRIDGERGLVFENVLARVSDQFRLEMHIDTDEANAAGVKNGDTSVLISK